MSQYLEARELRWDILNELECPAAFAGNSEIALVSASK